MIEKGRHACFYEKKLNFPTRWRHFNGQTIKIQDFLCILWPLIFYHLVAKFNFFVIEANLHFNPENVFIVIFYCSVYDEKTKTLDLSNWSTRPNLQQNGMKMDLYRGEHMALLVRILMGFPLQNLEGLNLSNNKLRHLQQLKPLVPKLPGLKYLILKGNRDIRDWDNLKVCLWTFLWTFSCTFLWTFCDFFVNFFCALLWIVFYERFWFEVSCELFPALF